MVDVPQQDWSVYQTRTHERDAAWIRGLTPSDRFALYEDLFNMIWGARRSLGDWQRLDRWNWQQKVAARLRLVDAFSKLDRIQRGQTARHNAG